VGTGQGVQTKDVILLFSEGASHEPVQKFVEHIVEWDEQTYEQTFNIYKYNSRSQFWPKLGVKIARPMASVVLPPSIKSYLQKDMEDFLAPETFRWYKDHGIPYKRSYLLHGPPGSGKSSIIQAIAGHYKLNLCYIQPIDPNFTDDSFTDAIQKAPKNALIVLEDIDTYFSKDREPLNKKCPLTFSGLLNGLDGVAAADGQVFILTTNFIDKLDAALIRTGRVDVKFEFPKVSAEMACEMFLQFYPNEDLNANSFKTTVAQILSETDLCMADLQQHFISHRKSTANVAAEKNQIKKEITGEQLKNMTSKLLEMEKEKIKENEKEKEKEKEKAKEPEKEKAKEPEKEKAKEPKEKKEPAPEIKEVVRSISKFGPFSSELLALAVGVGVGIGIGLLGSGEPKVTSE